MRPIDELAAEICTLTGHINAANHRWLMLVAEYDRRNGWSDGATQSCAHWLNWKCGVGMGVRGFRRCQDAEELSREAQQQQTRCVSIRHDDDGSLILNCRLPAEAGAKILKALELAVAELPVDPYKGVPAGTFVERVPFSVRRADALALVAESFLAHGALEVRGTDRHQIIVHVAAETLRDRTAGCCEHEHGPAMAAETARRLACDASVVTLIENDDGEPLNVGRKTRTISAPLRRLLIARDKGCRFPGCANSRYIDAHHVNHWANGGETKPSNLVSLCRFHHRAVHEGGIRIEVLDDGALRLVKKDGVAIDSVLPGCSQPLGDWKQLPAGQMANGWRGERMDCGLGVEVLLQQARRAKNVPAGTS